MSRYQALADELREQIRDDKIRKIAVETECDSGEEIEVWVALEDMHQFDKACTIAYDHGFTPNGIITDLGPAARFKPRTETESDI